MSNQARVSNGLLWVFIALYVLMGAARLLHNPHLQRLMPFISVAILMGFAIVHGIRRYGWRHFVFFFIVAFVISWSYETLSILTGFPFGHYIYTDNLGPKLWLVPLLIMPVPRACELRDGDVGSLYRSGQLDDIRLLDLA
jgi:putative membrane protein